ncbi:MAG: hypothetical protein U0804_17745 [Gemmataceae bacterium]
MATSSRALAALALAAAAAGCGGGISAPRTHPVSGTVTYKGKAAAGVKVSFHPQFDMGAVNFVPSATTGQDGKFSLSTAAPNDGAPAGDYVVTFELLKAGTDKRGLDVEVDAWKGKYGDPAASDKKVTVRSGDNALPPFVLD